MRRQTPLGASALLWWLADEPQLGRRARGLIEDPANDILISVASLWEMAVKLRVGKLHADLAAVMEEAKREGFVLLGVTPTHLLVLATLPMHHRDPFDHLLIAQAITEDAVFLSEDTDASKYPVRTVLCSSR